MSDLSELIGEDRVWESLINSIRGRTKRGTKGFINMNCPMCVSRGETQDKRRRCGIRKNHDGVGINCYNCGFKARFAVGNTLTKNMQNFLTAVGMDSGEIGRLVFWAIHVSNMVFRAPDQQVNLVPKFSKIVLPRGCKTLSEWGKLGCDDEHFINAAEYLFSRGDDIAGAIPYYWTPETTDNINQRLIIPCYIDNELVGWTGRAVGPISPKYVNQTPSNMLFNADVMNKPGRKFVIVSEGIFDALAVDGVGTIGAELSPAQITWINSSEKIKIVVPDRDRAGLRLLDLAVKHDWAVAFPGVRSHDVSHKSWWDVDIKDPAAACERYGRIWTLRSILATATTNKFDIALKRNAFV